MKNKISLIALLSMFATAAMADPIIVTPIGGATDGGEVDGYVMTPVGDQDDTDTGDASDDVDCIASPISGDICFTGRNGAESDIDIVENPAWWQYEHGDVFVTNQNWIEILLPANTRALSFWVGASFAGRAWIQAENGDYQTARTHFRVGSGNTSGYAYSASAGECASITKIIIEPTDWGFGNLSINQDACVSVPEPAPMALLLAGLLGLVLTRKVARI